MNFIHSLGAVAKLHICGDTGSILKGMIETGADIIDVDHLVPSMAEYSGFLGTKQVFSGKCDPVTIIQDGSEQDITREIYKDYNDANGRCIVSAGCEITPGTPLEKMIMFRKAADKLLQG